MAEIVWTLEASRCLDEIYEYIASESPASAHKVVSGIYEKVQILRQHVRIGQRYERIADREVREILYGHYPLLRAIAPTRVVAANELAVNYSGRCNRREEVDCEIRLASRGIKIAISISRSSPSRIVPGKKNCHV